MAIEKVFHEDDKIKKRVTNFFDQASIFVPNKFIVVLFGEYVESAIAYMQSKIDAITDSKLKGIASKNFDVWVLRHYDEVGKFVELKWTCSSVNIPSVNSETEDGDYLIDSRKGIRYPLIKTHVKIQTLAMRIIEDRKMMMYQFFNALTNQFHSPTVLKPTSSFHKLGVIVIPLNSSEGSGIKTKTNETIDTFGQLKDSFNNNNIIGVPSQIFEFNSAVLTNVETINLSNKNKNPLEYGITFKVPNTFQGSFSAGLSGLRNNTSDRTINNKKLPGEISDSTTLKENDSNQKSISDRFDYNVDALEVNPNSLTESGEKNKP